MFMSDTIKIIIAAGLLGAFFCFVATSSYKQERRHHEFMDSMTYCEQLDYRLEHQISAIVIQAIAMEKMAAYQAGQCPDK